MYTRAEIERQLKTRKTWTGKQVARVLFSNFFAGFKLGKNIISNDEITEIQNKPKNKNEAIKIMAYSKLYVSLMDVYNIINSYSEQAISSVALLNNSLMVHFKMLQFRQSQLNSPLMITEKQEAQYLKNYESYLKERIVLNSKKQESFLSFLLNRDNFFLYSGFDDKKTTHSQNTKLILSKYKVVKLSDPEFAHKLCNRIFPKGIQDPEFTLTDEQKVFGPAPQEYVDAIAKQYRYKTNPLHRYGEKVLKEVNKLMYYHQHHFSFKDALSKSIKKYPVVFPKGDPFPMPQNMTKYDFLVKVILPGYIRKGLFNSINQQELNTFLIKEYGDYLIATKEDAINDHPQLKKLFDKSSRPLDILGTWKELSDAGITEYNPKPTKDNYDYGKWRGFPDRYKKRVRDYGYAVYHDAGAINNFELRFTENNDFLLEDLKQETSRGSKSQRQHAYKLIEQYLTIYQAYIALIRGIRVWTGIKEVNELIYVSNGFHTLTRKTTEYNNLLYSEYAGLRKLFKTGEDKKKAIQLLDSFEPIDPDKKRIPHSTNQALSDYLETMFTPGRPQNATMLINAIAVGLNSGGGSNE